MDYQKLDDLLKYLKESEGYKGWNNYKAYKEKVLKISDNESLEKNYPYQCNLLLRLGLVDYQKGDSYNGIHQYAINFKGLDLLNSGKSTKDLHNDLLRREKLEEKILESTLESHELSKLSTEIALQSTRLNKIQLWVTIILGAVSTISILSLFFQCEANKIAKRNLEIVEKTYQLESKKQK